MEKNPRTVIEYILSHFKKTSDQFTDETKISDIISDVDMYPPATTKSLMDGDLKLTFGKVTDDKGKKVWKRPSDWYTLTVGDLISKLTLLILFIAISLASTAQLQLSIGALKTGAKAKAIGVGIVYARSLDSLFKNSDYFTAKNHSFFTVAPTINVQTGTADAFSSIEIKATGMLTTFSRTDVGGFSTMNLDKLINVFPFSVGAEADNTFNRINGIAEVGWIPWYQSMAGKSADFIKKSKIGIFAQAGRKFYTDTSTDKAIVRIKGNFSIDTKTLLYLQGLNVGLAGTADGWYDVLHNKYYHRIKGAARFYLTDDNFFDLEYQNGSGAPNFFTGSQYGLNLVVTF